MSALEAVVLYVRDEIVQPNVGRKWVNTWTPLLLTFFIFILSANAIGLIPLFDVVALIDHYVLHTGARLVPEERRARRHDGDGELQRHGGAGDDYVRRDHRRRARRRTGSSSTGRTSCRTGSHGRSTSC